MNPVSKMLSATLMVVIPAYGIHAQTQQDSIKEMKSVVVVGKAATTVLRKQKDDALTLSTSALFEMPKILGNADPVRYAQMMPGVQTNNETDGGLHIQGSDNMHNDFNMGGVPIYNAIHLLGLFSVFNAPHYSSMTLKKSPNSASDASRLGGTFSLDLPTSHYDSLSAELAVGPISSQGTLRMPLGKKHSLTLSGRGSYINLLYSPWLRKEDFSLNYRFYDLNATWLYTPSSRHRLWFDFYGGRDNAFLNDDKSNMSLPLKWGNQMAALHWLFQPDEQLKLKQTIYLTRNNNKAGINLEDYHFLMPSDICDLGYRSRLDLSSWSAGAEAVWHNIQPQSPEGELNVNTTLKPQPRLHSSEFTLWGEYHHTLLPHLEASAGLRAKAFLYDEGHHLALDPSARLEYSRDRWQMSLSYSLRHQYLFQTGVTSMNMPVEFWMSSGKDLPPMWGHNVTLGGQLFLLDDMLSLSADVYYKRLYNQQEYHGDLMMLITAPYDLQQNLLRCDGHNYGASVMVRKTRGKWTGWVSYAYGRAKRHVEGQTFPASHERPHEINAFVNWQLNDRWSLSSCFVYASGTPFTAPKSFYLMNGMLHADYAAHNSRRLSPYYRLDLSANLDLKKHPRWFGRSLTHGLNFSLYNATFHNNDIFMRLKQHEGKYLYSHLTLISFALPSVNYYIKF